MVRNSLYALLSLTERLVSLGFSAMKSSVQALLYYSPLFLSFGLGISAFVFGSLRIGASASIAVLASAFVGAGYCYYLRSSYSDFFCWWAENEEAGSSTSRSRAKFRIGTIALSTVLSTSGYYLFCSFYGFSALEIIPAAISTGVVQILVSGWIVAPVVHRAVIKIREGYAYHRKRGRELFGSKKSTG